MPGDVLSLCIGNYRSENTFAKEKEGDFIMHMRRKLATFLVILTVLLLSAFVLTGCDEEKPACVHEWTEATCEAPRTCSLCGATEGAALGHAGGTATCTVRATCEVCGKEYGELAAHTGGTATCQEQEPVLSAERNTANSPRIPVVRQPVPRKRPARSAVKNTAILLRTTGRKLPARHPKLVRSAVQPKV